MKRRDANTLDLFRDFEPKPVVERFAEADVRAGTPAGRLKRALAKVLKDSGLSRVEIAQAMTIHLGETVPVSMIEACASQAKESHNISAVRLAALVAVTDDSRLANTLLADTGLVAVPARFEALIRREMASEAREKLDREIAAADAQWRARR